MIVAFYGIYVLVTPANWSWLWFFIALIMSLYQWLRRPVVEHMIEQAMDEAKNINNHLGGPFA